MRTIRIFDLEIGVSINSRNVARQMRDLEKQGEATDRSLSGIGDGAERSEKKATGAFGKIGRSLRNLRTEAKRGVEVNVGADTSGLRAGEAEVARFRRAAGDDVTVNVDVDTGASAVKVGVLRTAVAGFTSSLSRMDDGLSAGGLRITAFAGAAVAAASLLAPLLGGLTVVGSLGASAAAGFGLVGGAAAVMAQKIKAGEAGFTGIKAAYEDLKATFTDVFSPAARSLSHLGADVLRFANNWLPTFGAAARANVGALADGVRRLMDLLNAPAGRSAIATLLAAANNILSDLTRAAAHLSVGLLSAFSVATPQARALADWIRRISAGFREWAQSTAGANAIRAAVQSSVPVFRALWDMVVRVGGALLRFGTDNAGAIASAIRIVTTVLTGLINGFSAVTRVIGPFNLILAMLAPLVLGAMLVVGQMVTGLGSLITVVVAAGGALGSVATVLAGPWGLALAAAAVGVAALIRHFGGLRGTLNAARNAIAPVIGVLRNLGTVVKGLFTGNTGTEQFRRSFAALPRPVQTAVKTIVTAWRSLKTGFQQGWTQVKPILTAVGNGIRTALGTAIRFLISQGRAAVAAFRQNWPQIKAAVLPVLAAIGNAIRTGAGAAFRFLLSQARVIVRWFQTNWPLIRRTTATVFNFVKGTIQNVLRGVLAIVRAVVGQVVRFWRAHGQQVTSIARSLWNTVKTIVSAGVRIVLGLVKAGMQLITGDWRGAWNTIKNVLSIAWNAIKQLVKNSLNIVKNLLQLGWAAIRSVAQSGWTAIKNTISGIWEAWQRSIASVRDQVVAGLKTAWENIRQGAVEAWDRIKSEIADRVGGILTTVNNFIEDIKSAVNTVLGLVGLPKLGEGGSDSGSSGAGSPPKNSGQQRQENFARGGVFRADRGGVAGPGRMGLVGEAGDDEAIVNLSRKTPESQMAFREAARSPNAGGAGTQEGDTGRAARTHRTARRLGSGHPMARGRQEGFGPATYVLVEPLKKIADEIAAKYNTPWNSYTNHPPNQPMSNQPYWRERSVDWWGSGGRGDPIGSVWSDVASSATSMLGSNLEYMLTPSNDPAGHWDHVHVSAFIGQDNLGTATGSGASGGGIDPRVAIFEEAWERLVQKPLVDPVLGPLKNASFLPAQIAGAAAQKIPDGIKEWISSQLGSMGGSGEYKGGGSLDEWITNGFALGNVFPDSASNHEAMKGRIMQESGGDPNAVNNWDSNAAAGTPSKGLVQIIEPTWNSNTTDEIGQFDQNWMDPVKSVAVSSRYMKAQYGYVVGSNGSGYDRGGLIKREHQALVHPNELYIPLDQPSVMRTTQNMFGSTEILARLDSLEGAIRDNKEVELGGRSQGAIREGAGRTARHIMGGEEGRGFVERHTAENNTRTRIRAGQQ